jgi:hypothetical protein
MLSLITPFGAVCNWLPAAVGFFVRVESTEQARATKIHSAMDHASTTFASRIQDKNNRPGFVPHLTFLSGEHVAVRIIP